MQDKSQSYCFLMEVNHYHWGEKVLNRIYSLERPITESPNQFSSTIPTAEFGRFCIGVLVWEMIHLLNGNYFALMEQLKLKAP